LNPDSIIYNRLVGVYHHPELPAIRIALLGTDEPHVVARLSGFVRCDNLSKDERQSTENSLESSIGIQLQRISLKNSSFAAFGAYSYV
jgi:hypothetical protein